MDENQIRESLHLPLWEHRTDVYPFGVLWFWKCQDKPCGHGGRSRTKDGAQQQADQHTKESTLR